ncbi:MAG: hypothetical protein KDC92_13880, partial [Bacteroidetes bacterium]|nr:hypothetical protein [Bacteroidota bacterium]
MGNVLATILDRRTLHDVDTGYVGGDSVFIALWDADIINAQDYYPFGMLLPNRVYQADSTGTGGYRYAFNGMERDDEWNGAGNAYDFEARIYDARLGRWLAIDPLASRYPFESGYVFCSNIPLKYKDPNGKKKTLTITYKDHKTGETIQEVVVETNEIAVVWDGGNGHRSPSEYEFCDLVATQVIYFDQEKGEVTSREKEESELGIIRMTSQFPFLGKRRVDDGELDDYEGIMWTKSGGQGQETRTSSKFVIEDIDLLMATLGAGNSAASAMRAKDFLEIIKYLTAAFDIANDGQSHLAPFSIEKFMQQSRLVYECTTMDGFVDLNGNHILTLD